MLIDCPACARSYHVGRDQIGAQGRTVICPRCDASWLVNRDGDAVIDELATAAVSARVEPRIVPSPSPRAAPFGAAWPLAVAVCGIAGLMLLIGARERVVRVVPRLARLYAVAGLPVNVRGLDFAAVRPVRVAAPVPTMVVSGEIRNVVAKRIRLPRVTFAVRDAAGAPILTWSEAAPAAALGAGKTIAFASQPHDIPVAAATVLVGFDDAAPSVRPYSGDR